MSDDWFQADEVPALFKAGRLVFVPSVAQGARKYAAVCLAMSRRAGGGPFEVPAEVLAELFRVGDAVAAKRLAEVEQYKAIERVNPGESPAIYRFTATVYDSEKGTAFAHVAREAAALAPRVTITPDPGPDCHPYAVLAWRMQRHWGDANVPIAVKIAAEAVGGSAAKSAAALKELVRRGVLDLKHEHSWNAGEARRYRFVASVAVAG